MGRESKMEANGEDSSAISLRQFAIFEDLVTRKGD